MQRLELVVSGVTNPIRQVAQRFNIAQSDHLLDVSGEAGGHWLIINIPRTNVPMFAQVGREGSR
jgi:hypothetical protein